MERVVGIDWAKGGWLGVWRAGDEFEFALYDDVAEVRSACADAQVIAVDVPIGLSDTGPRDPDVAARRFVGGRRASSVFSAPVRGVLDARSQAEASARHRAIDGRGFGAQAFGILPLIRQWDEEIAGDPELARRVYEIHPEVSFVALAGGQGLAEPKKSRAGHYRRVALLGQAFGFATVTNLLERVPRSVAAADDVLDALAALWTGERIAAGKAGWLPDPPARDAAGQRMAIAY